MNKDYQRGYSKGYNTGKRSADALLADERARAEQAVQRSERAEKEQGLGHCEDCKYWRRGDRPANGWSSCTWGICDAPRAAGTPWGAWACLDTEIRDAKIQTTPRFGCVIFMMSNVQGVATAEGGSPPAQSYAAHTKDKS